MSLNRKIHLEMFKINQTTEKEFGFLRLTSCLMLQPVFFILFLVICVLFPVVTSSLTLKITPSQCVHTNPPISNIMGNLVIRKIISLANLFEECDMITFLLTHCFVPIAVCDSHIHMIICSSCSYNIGSNMFHIYMNAMSSIHGFI